MPEPIARNPQRVHARFGGFRDRKAGFEWEAAVKYKAALRVGQQSHSQNALYMPYLAGHHRRIQ